MREIDLPPKVENSLNKICNIKGLPPVGWEVRQKLANAGEKQALLVLSKAYNTKMHINNLDAYIAHLIHPKPLNRRLLSAPAPVPVPVPVPVPSPVPVPDMDAFSPPAGNVECSGHQILKRHADLSSSMSIQTARPTKICRQLSFREMAPPDKSYQASVFSKELDYKKEFLIYNYIGKKKLEDVVSDVDADAILEWMKDKSMDVFESRLWDAYGRKNCSPKDRRQDFDWNSEKSFLYHCEVSDDGCHRFKGPVLSTTTTHLHRTLGDENVLIVKFIDVGSPCNLRTLVKGIHIGLKHFRFFVSKDEGKTVKKKGGREGNETKATTTVKCYFIRPESLPSYRNNESCDQPITELRCHFMHIHKVPSLAKFMPRFSLILSKTVKLPIDFSRVVVERIDDIPCRDDKGRVICDEAGDALILTDGTGFISEDLAMKCPPDFSLAKYIKEKDFKKIFRSAQMADVLHEEGMVELNKDPPLLMQCRLFSKGSAVKGTLLINRKLEAGKIQVRPSMVKVETDMNCIIAPTFDSLEIVAISHKPGRCHLSKNLIALLSYGGVPKEFFMDLLSEALKQSQNVFSDYRAALKVAVNGDMDDNATATRMILAGVPLEEPHLQTCLASLARLERRSLGEGRLPISDSFYLMGTVDPTGSLDREQVCVILGNRQISGKLLRHFKPSQPWTRVHSTPPAVNKKPAELSAEELEYEIFRLVLNKQKPSYSMGIAADSWTAFMDILLILRGNNTHQNEELMQKILKLIDLYYDALDAPKTGKEVIIPPNLKADKYPHYMKRSSSYHSTSVLGEIFDKVQQFHCRKQLTSEICKLPDFDVKIPDERIEFWRKRHIEYRREMAAALENKDGDLKSDAANRVIEKYIQMLYKASELKESTRKKRDIYNDSLAIYHVTYNHAITREDASKCSFAWRVAASALCRYHAKAKAKQDHILMVPSVLHYLKGGVV